MVFVDSTDKRNSLEKIGATDILVMQIANSRASAEPKP